jgi:hypothetical protein
MKSTHTHVYRAYKNERKWWKNLILIYFEWIKKREIKKHILLNRKFDIGTNEKKLLSNEIF